MRFHMGLVFMETDHVVELCKTADELGYFGALIPDHIFYPQELKSSYLYSSKGDGTPSWGPETNWPDPWCVVSAASSVTTNLHFTTGVYVAPARDIFTVAKLVSTAAYLSTDRVHLGLAPGWCEEEFVGTGQDFATRGKRLNEMIPALREIWKGGWREFHGEYVDFPPMQMNPVPRQPIPIYVGGDTEPALRRAALLADGWIGAGPYSPEEASHHVARLKEHLAREGRESEDFPIYLGIYALPDIDLYRRFADEGVTDFICAPWLSARTSPDDGSDMLLKARIAECERFATDILAKV